MQTIREYWPVNSGPHIHRPLGLISQTYTSSPGMGGGDGGRKGGGKAGEGEGGMGRGVREAWGGNAGRGGHREGGECMAQWNHVQLF